MDNYEIVMKHDVGLIDWLEQVCPLFSANSLAHKPLDNQQWPLETSTTPQAGIITTHINFNCQNDCTQMSTFLKSQNLEHQMNINQVAPWQEYHQKFMQPLEVGQLTIQPCACPDQPEKNVLYFPAGLGFGTGHHETTKGCLALMQKINLEGKHLLDFGSGSGILSVAGGILGAQTLSFLDIDKQAMAATAANIDSHGYKDKALPCEAHTVSKHIDCIVANILCAPLIDNLRLFSQLLKLQDSHLITSGVLDEQSEVFEQKFSEHFVKVDCLKENQWCTYLWKKR